MTDKVLITGGAGFIGLFLAKKLMSKYRVDLIDNFYRGKKDYTFNSILKEKPIIKPGKKITLNSDYLIKSKLATTIGYFSIISLNNSAIFKAHIPKIKLTHPEILN